MFEIIGNVVRYIVILIFLATLLEMILPHGQFRRYLRMLVGILLILTLISPIQNIMRLAPGWDVPAYLAAPTGKDELALILERGEEMHKDALQAAISKYRYHLFSVVENLLAKEYEGELLELEVNLNEDPKNGEFGAIENMVVVIGEKKQTPVVPEGSVEEINIAVRREDKVVISPLEREKVDAVSPHSETEVALAAYLAGYFMLEEEQVAVRIIP